MNRRNYARRSGVIIDACKDHGIWFDADELPRILAWVRAGGKAEAEQQEADETARQEQRDFALKMSRRGRSHTQEWQKTDDGSDLATILAGLVTRWFI